MGATNTTTHYNLSQFISTDKPAWLQDYNGDMAKIDAGINEAKVAADTAQTTANAASGASTQNANDISALQTDVSGQGSNITALQLAVNTINSLIGNGTPTTTDQTIIGAINEINARVSTDKFGSDVDISGYNANNNRFEVPSDGYVFLQHTTHTTNTYSALTVYDADGGGSFGLQSTYNGSFANGASLFVKKGFRIQITTNGTCTAHFLPLTN